AREDKPGDKRLAAYFVPCADANVDIDFDIDGLRKHLSATLPQHMIPAAMVPLQAMPLSINGKLDRKALPVPGFTSADLWQAPRTPQEEILCSMFADLLGIPTVGIHDNFFHLGGHSLLAMRLISQARSTLGFEISIRTV